MKNLFSKLRMWFYTIYQPRQSDLQMLRNAIVMQRREYETRIQSLEHDVRRLCTMLEWPQVSVTTDEKLLKQHFNTVVSESVMKWLTNWADERYAQTDDIESLVEDAISNGSCVDDAVECKLDNEDWDYRLRDSLDWDKVSEKVADKLDWQTIVSDNELLTRDDIDLDDVMLKSEHMSEDDIVTRDELSDMVVGELKRDWFEQKIRDDVRNIFKDTLQAVRETEEDNCRNAIDDAIQAKLDLLIAEQLVKKFGPEFDIWFHNLVAHAVQKVINEMVTASYKEITKSEGESNA